MANVNTTARPRATVEAATTPIIHNVTCTLANTEYFQSLSTNVKKYIIRARNGSEIKLAFDSGDSGILYLTIPKWCSFSDDALNFNGTLYFQVSNAGEIIEILEWS